MSALAATRDSSAQRTWRALRASTRLGWEISSNWTRPALFLIYAVLRPVSAALILAVMYRVVAGDSEQTRGYLGFLVVGSAFWSFAQQAFTDFANAISEDRGRYRQLKYIYTAPVPFTVYLLGRAASQLGSALASVAVVLLMAAPLLHLHLNPRDVDWPLLLVATLLGAVAVMSLAMACSVLLLGAHDSYGYGEIIASCLYIIGGAIFPIAVLPGALSTLAAWLPLAYWLELTRRALLHDPAAQMFASTGDLGVLMRLLGTTVLLIVLSAALLRYADRRARGQGLIDKETHW